MFIYATAAIVALIAVSTWYLLKPAPRTPSAPETTAVLKTTPAPSADPNAGVRDRRSATPGSGSILKKESAVLRRTDARSSHARNPATGSQANQPFEGPSPQAKLHYQKTQMFMAEAKETLPVIGIRAFNAIRAEERQQQAAAEKGNESVSDDKVESISTSAPYSSGGLASAGDAGETGHDGSNTQGDDGSASDDTSSGAADPNGSPAEGSQPSENDSDGEETMARDDKGLRDGEIWIRIDPSNSREYKEIMAQTADLYRVDTGYQDEVTVLLWVGGQVMARETYGE